MEVHGCCSTRYLDSKPTRLCSFFPYAACVAEKQQITAFSLWFDPIERTIYLTQVEHANHYTIEAGLHEYTQQNMTKC
jgi:hypothetical protein